MNLSKQSFTSIEYKSNWLLPGSPCHTQLDASKHTPRHGDEAAGCLRWKWIRRVPSLQVCRGQRLGCHVHQVCPTARSLHRQPEADSIPRVPSRSGEPKWETVTASASPPPWAHQVSWERADILRPVTYTALLKGADYVVHSMGILLEADYKGLVSGQESPVAGLQKLFAPARPDRGANPLDREPGEDLAPGADPKDQMSYEVMNRDSAVALARHAADEGAAAFCYMSAAGGAPVLPARYLSTKREAEALIARSFPRMRGVFVRAPLMWDSSRTMTMGVAAMAGAGTLFNTLTGHYLKDFIGAAGVKPLKAETVAEAIVEALSDDTVRGPVEVAQIEELASKAWRKTML